MKSNTPRSVPQIRVSFEFHLCYPTQLLILIIHHSCFLTTRSIQKKTNAHASQPKVNNQLEKYEK